MFHCSGAEARVRVGSYYCFVYGCLVFKGIDFIVCVEVPRNY
jgi:hypothetical protein